MAPKTHMCENSTYLGLRLRIARRANNLILRQHATRTGRQNTVMSPYRWPKGRIRQKCYTRSSRRWAHRPYSLFIEFQYITCHSHKTQIPWRSQHKKSTGPCPPLSVKPLPKQVESEYTVPDRLHSTLDGPNLREPMQDEPASLEGLVT